MVITGLIRPPPEIRAVADKTAQFVAKNGRAFEDRIINSAKGKTPKFAFLDPKSPFHAYYEDKISFYEQGGEDVDEKEVASKAAAETKRSETAKKQDKTPSAEAVRKKEKSIKASAQDPVAVALLAQRNKIAQAREAATSSSDKAVTSEEGAAATPPPSCSIEPPPPIQYVNIVAPSNLTLAQIETIQLVAQFAALDGKNGPFLQMLAMKEWHNPIFSFLQPRHGHFAYFSALVDAYRRILGLWTNSAAPVSGAGFDRLVDKMANNVNTCLEMAAYRAEYDRDVGQREKQNNEETSFAAQIDWHDFVVVETIDFPASEIVLPPPPPPPPKFTLPKATIKPTAPVPVPETMDESDDEEEGENIRVVSSYTPNVVSTGTLVKDRTHVIDPITGKSVPVADMPEHMRIQLLDPKWAEERRKFQEKQKDSNLVSGDVIANNLSRLAQARGVGKNDEDSKAKGREAKRDQTQTQSDSGSSKVSGLPYSATGVNEPLSKRPRTDDTQFLTGTTVVPTPAVLGGPPPPLLNPPSAFPPVPPLPPPPVPPSLAPPPLPTGAPSEVETTAGSESQLLSEAEFIATLTKPEVTLQIRVPNDPSQMAWNFYGQIVSLSVNVMSKVKEVKEQLSTTHLNNMPANKIQLKSVLAGAFLKDNLSLAQLNIGPTATLELVPKIRGGRK